MAYHRPVRELVGALDQGICDTAGREVAHHQLEHRQISGRGAATRRQTGSGTLAGADQRDGA